MVAISVAKDFTRYPAGRYERNGNTSGEGFRKRFLEKPIAHGESVTIELDGTIGYGSSFLEEAFGGLVRTLKISSRELSSKLELVSSDRVLLDEIRQYIGEASDSLGLK